MFRSTVMGALLLMTGAAWAQQTLPQGDTISSPLPASNEVAKPVVAMEQPLPGDHWTYEIRDEITGNVTATRSIIVTEVTPNEITVRFKVAGNNNEGLNVYDRSWNLKSSGPWKYSPHDGNGISPTLKVGDSWKSQSDEVNAGNGNILKRSGNSKIVGQEKITTKAGTFDTFKIERNSSAYRTNDPTSKGEAMSQTWYAPVIDHWVKRIYITRVNGHLRANETIELVEYGRKAAPGTTGSH